MEYDYKLEDKDNSQVSLKITIPNSEIKEEYNTQLKDVQKNAVINGFRKGKVPVSVIEMKYKSAILS